MEWLAWLNTNAPAVQAVGTLLAVAIAIYVPFKIHRNETRKQEQEVLLKGQALAILIDPLLQSMRIEIDLTMRMLELHHADKPRHIEVPGGIWSRSEDLWTMGDAGAHVLQLIGQVQTHNRANGAILALPLDVIEKDKDKWVTSYNDRLILICESLKDAIDATKALVGQRN